MKTIFIDTASNKQITVGIIIDSEKTMITQEIGISKAQSVLPLIRTLLRRKKLSLKESTEVMVNQGPGSYTGLRVGVAIANTLGFLLKIPVNGKPIGEYIDPVYT